MYIICGLEEQQGKMLNHIIAGKKIVNFVDLGSAPVLRT